ncbi:MAG: DUF4430 domain-containing protein [Actinobacteria bacterium]|nr:DUF4430 domain-containing protein [Actinomycetota bacterium]
MFRHCLISLGVALVLALAGCGGSEGSESGNAEDTVSAAAPAEDQAAVLVTKDCGKSVVLAKTEVEAGQTAMQALDRVADIETASGGKFVSEIEDVAQDNAKKLAWLYYVNGEAAQKGATEIELAPGDVEWWDLHNYEQECASVPAEAR